MFFYREVFNGIGNKIIMQRCSFLICDYCLRMFMFTYRCLTSSLSLDKVSNVRKPRNYRISWSARHAARKEDIIETEESWDWRREVSWGLGRLAVWEREGNLPKHYRQANWRPLPYNQTQPSVHFFFFLVLYPNIIDTTKLGLINLIQIWD